jgi:ATP-binding protein involved in chromosome partitioning
MAIDEHSVLNALRMVRDPDLGRDIVALGFVKDVKICGGAVSFTIELTTPACPVREQMRAQARAAVAALPGVETVEVRLTSQVRTGAARQGGLLPAGIRNVVPVASGKGGVGKSTVAANLALALAHTGARVGMMDADAYGPSQPTILGKTDPPVRRSDGRLEPPIAHGVKTISMGYFLKPDEVTLWRGPMLHKMIEQFFGGVAWGELDYLIVDLPPGTGDVQLSLCQAIPLTGAVVVTTPQDVALNVAKKAIFMFHRLNTPILGLVENMAYYVCPHCGSRDDVFGAGGGRRCAEQLEIPFLGEIPLLTSIRTTSDAGIPIVVAQPDSPGAQAFRIVAENLAAQISIHALGAGAAALPKVEPADGAGIRIAWPDGGVSHIAARDLRIACPCAACVDETTGRRRLDPARIPEDVHARAIRPVGRYAVHIEWSDGHTTGIYSFDLLRRLATLR